MFFLLYNNFGMKKNKNIKLLDCTLRDGGSLINWNFTPSCVLNILQLLNDSNIDIIEAGFLQDDSFNLEYYNNLFSKIHNKKAKTAIMINLGHYDTNQICNKTNANIDLIRLMFKKTQLKDAFDLAQKLTNKGYSISLNPVSVTSYDKNELEQLLTLSDKLKPEVIYIIDTYGLLNKHQTLKYLKLFDSHLDKKIQIGFHAHNNKQLAFSNSVEIIEKSDRNIIIDGSLYGMGKRAGNAPTELTAQYLNLQYKKNYNINTISKIIESEIIPLKNKYEWGYNLIHYTAAINNCHSDYVTYLYEDKSLSFEQINKAVNLIHKDKKLTFDKSHIEKIYRSLYE